MPVALYLVTEVTDEEGNVVLSTRAPFDSSVLAAPKLIQPNYSLPEALEGIVRSVRAGEVIVNMPDQFMPTAPKLPAAVLRQWADKAFATRPGSDLPPAPRPPLAAPPAIPLVETDPSVVEMFGADMTEYKTQSSTPVIENGQPVLHGHRAPKAGAKGKKGRGGASLLPLNGTVFGIGDDD